MSKMELYQGDCRELLKYISPQRFDVIIIDPPYGIDRANGSNGYGIMGTREYEGDWDQEPPSREMFELLLSYKKPTFIFGGNYFTDKLPVASHWIVWDKTGEIKFQNPYSDCELIWTNIPRSSVRKYVVIQQGFISAEKERYHPTQKPVQLLGRILNDYVAPGKIVLDCYMGSGSMGLACLRMGNGFIGIERDEGYYKIASRLIAEAETRPVMVDRTLEAEQMSLYQEDL